MLKKIIFIFGLIALTGCGQTDLDDIEPLEVETENTEMDRNQEDFSVDSDKIMPSITGPSTPPSVKGPTSPPPNS